MFQRIRNRAQEQGGFTLIELLVVILIIGILAAIAIPTFLNQQGKGYDAAAKSNVKTAQIAEETYSTDNNGAYTATTGNLTAIEKTLADPNGPTLTASLPAGGGYSVTETAVHTGDTFTITSDGQGNVTRTCTGTGGGCPRPTSTTNGW